jgi:hypothetical protein
MAEPDGQMGGAAWPPDWQTGWVTGRWSDIKGTSPLGGVRLTNSVQRAVARLSKTTVNGGFVEFPIANGVPGGPDAQENSDSIYCIEFPIGNDPDVVPAEMQLIAKENFAGGVELRKVLTAEHTLDNPLWLTDDLESVAAQPGVIQRFTWWIDLEASGVPATAQVGDAIVYIDTRKMFVIESL